MPPSPRLIGLLRSATPGDEIGPSLPKPFGALQSNALMSRGSNHQYSAVAGESLANKGSTVGMGRVRSLTRDR